MSSQPTASNKFGNSNALTHGGTSEKLFLAGENREDFEALLHGLQAEYLPETTQQRIFVEQLAMSHWILWRRDRACNVVELGNYNVESHPSRWTVEDYHRLASAERYKTAAERALKRALQNAESIRKQRLSEQDRVERHNRTCAKPVNAKPVNAKPREQLQKQNAAAAKPLASKLENTVAETAAPAHPPQSIHWSAQQDSDFVSQKTPFLRPEAETALLK